MKKLVFALFVTTFTAFGGSFNVYVYYPSGSAYSGARVVGEVCGLGGMTKNHYTDQKGYVLLKWADDSTSLCSVCINGVCHNGRYSGGDERAFKSK